MKKVLIFLFLSIVGTIAYIRESEVVPVFKNSVEYSFDIDMELVKKSMN
ncbi:hypothetical protein [Streptobacillus canis]|nr:hypothetical protein [Streptobacillus canis]